jgi:hemoglobin/transferrin/lactoferrin receptor protein
VDQLVANEDKYVQKNTAFKQYNLMQKLSYKTNLGFEHGLNLQFSTSTDIPRYDRLTETDPSTGLGMRNGIMVHKSEYWEFIL